MAQKTFCVSDKLFALIGDKMVKLWNDLMPSKPVKTLKEVIRKLIQPKEINQHGNIEGSGLLECEDEEIPSEDYQEEGIDDGVPNEDVQQEKHPVQNDAIRISPSIKILVHLRGL